MKIFVNDNHRDHEAKVELVPGQFARAIETADRIESVRKTLQTLGFAAPVNTGAASPEDLLAIHDAGYLSFLQSAWHEWARAFDPAIDGLPFVWPHRNRPPRIPRAIEGKIGYYMFDGVSPVTQHMWAASADAAGAAGAAAEYLHESGKNAFALVRPPGHHACRDMGGGSSYINNTAFAAARLARSGARVAVLDVDAHHGNGTQDIFWASPGVLTVSIHCDPAVDYPYFSGYGDEAGGGAGEGFNMNLPLSPGSTWQAYAPALETAKTRIASFAPDFVVVALGVDAYKEDPSGKLKLEVEDFSRIGEAIAGIAAPKVFVFEGGYDLSKIGDCVARVLAPSS
ncbi:histone deacetylase family protein [Aestuariivirga sp.]|uniref:histone deacetylase family protein n=1 Tax=Aestuariivirga sp. TaxID=2650926 RepID=UPI0039E570A5